MADVARTYSPLRPDSWWPSSIGMAPSWCGRVLLEEDLLDPQLVLGVLGGVGQRDHERLGARVDELTQTFADVLRVEPQRRPSRPS